MRLLSLAACIAGAAAVCDSEDLNSYVGGLDYISGTTTCSVEPCPAADSRDSAVSVTQTGATSVTVTSTGTAPTNVWVADEDGYIYALSGTAPSYTFSSGEVLNLRTGSADDSSCRASMPSYYTVYAQWASDTYRTSLPSSSSWDTMIADFQGQDPEAGSVTLSEAQYTALNTWAPDASASDYSDRAASNGGGGSVTLSQPSWLGPVNALSPFLLFVKNDNGDTIYLHEFGVGTWPGTDSSFTSSEFVLGDGITALTACVALPTLPCDPDVSTCPTDYTDSSQKCSTISYLDNAVAAIEAGAPPGGPATLVYAEGTATSAQLSVNLFENTGDGSITLRLVPPSDCGTDAVAGSGSGTAVFAKNGAALLGYAKDSAALQVGVSTTDNIEVFLQCAGALSSGTVPMSSLTVGIGSGEINENPDSGGGTTLQPCMVNGVQYASGATYQDGEVTCTCTAGIGNCGEQSFDDDDSLTGNEKAIIAMCSLVLGLTLIAITVFVVKKSRAMRGRKGGGAYKQTEITGPPPPGATTTTIGPPPGPPPGADGVPKADLPVENV